MTNLFYNLGRKTGHAFWKGRWWYQSLFGSEKEAILAEYLIGQQIAKNIDQQFSRDFDKEHQNCVDSIGRHLISKLKNKQRKFHFNLFSNAQINAFALPGGFIYCSNSLLKFCQLNRDEIAFVLAHEIAHVVKRHPLKRVLANSSLNILSNLGKTSNLLGSITKQTMRKLLQSSYSQDQESEADRFSVKMMTVAGFDPNGAVHFLKKLEKIRSDQNSISKYLSSHPAFNERIEYLRQMISV